MSKKIAQAAFRRLRGYALDPSLSLSTNSFRYNQLTYHVRWENLELRDPDLGTGATLPTGEYIEVIDFDPASGLFYEPVNMDDPSLLAQDGFAPNVSNPQFHQQMVYAVIMTTIQNFEQALGRRVMWAEEIPSSGSLGSDGRRKRLELSFVRRLRVYPHALRQANAYYDPEKKALLFGYFQATPATPQLQLPGSTVFTCLSHDIVAHETAHAILDGIHRRYVDATHPDTAAFHEAFADMIALFQHFSFPDVLRAQISKTRGDLQQQSLLGQLALQFGQATGSYGSLRDAIGEFDESNHWKPRIPDPRAYATEFEPHSRGSLLVAAVFEAYLTVYQSRVERFRRIATGGTGVLPAGAIHPDLVEELAETAARTASEILRICIRALDYCPPVDVTFGDYLRAIITADLDLVSSDDPGYRIAFIEAFQRRGISAAGVESMAVEDLALPLEPLGDDNPVAEEISSFLRELSHTVGYLTDRREIYEKTKQFIGGRRGLHGLIEQAIVSGKSTKFRELTGLMFPEGEETCESKGLEFGYLTQKIASYAVGNVSLARRATPDGRILNHVIVTLAQKRGVRFRVKDDEITVRTRDYFVPDKTDPEQWEDNSIVFRGGCTLIFDLDTLRLRYAIAKPMDDRDRMIRQFRYQSGMMDQPHGMYFDKKALAVTGGPFAAMHSHLEVPGGSHVH